MGNRKLGENMNEPGHKAWSRMMTRAVFKVVFSSAYN